ncbi:MAG TPA: gephyrin-like molybdotransferase Glp, partial [Verrucomicrobiae bacterium]|nr:gephyrin-like molybdotransferase Glp [Verrucomicrobiae bacterium]
MLEFEDALAQVLAAVPKPAVETVSLAGATGRILMDPALASIDLPRFDNSAMDGYAVRAADVASARGDAPVRLRLAGRVEAGQRFAGELSPGMCLRLFTGSPLPRGADAVVMQEDTRSDPADGNCLLVLEPAQQGENIRFRGEDISRGAVLAPAGERLGFAQLSLLSAAGVAQLCVGRQPRVAILATGSELAEPGTNLAEGHIYESNRVALETLVRSCGGVPTVLPLVRDDLEETKAALADALKQADAIVTSGGASVGEMDFVKQAFQDSGGKLEFWKVAIKPGRPFVFGARGEKLLFGLPGNPVSALVTVLLLVRPALLHWQGATNLSLPAHSGLLAGAIANPGARRHFVR